MAEVISARILHKLVALLIDRVISQVHTQVVQVAALRRHVVLSRKSGKTFLVNEDSQRYHRCDENVDA